MSRKIIIAILVVTLVISSSFVSAIKVNSKTDPEDMEKLAQAYYDIVYNKTVTGNFCSKCSDLEFNESLWPYEASTVGTSTIFIPPYTTCYSWGYGTPGIDEYSHGCNKNSGSIGAFANAFIGGATAEGMQQLNFYVGRTKSLEFDVKIVRTGGKTTFGFGAFAGTEKTWSWDDFQENYHRSDVDPWWSWESIILIIMNLVTILVGFAPGGIAEAIEFLSMIVDFEALATQLQEMLDDDDAEILHITFSFTADPGWHSIWVGLRATASACITGTGSAVTMGQVSDITIDGIAAPDSPIIIGTSNGKVGESYEFSVNSIDPNGDKIKYYFDWGDGSNSGWTDYVNSGTNVYNSHIYSEIGVYKVRVTVEDIDKMQSEAIYTININEKNRLKNLVTNDHDPIFNNFSTLAYIKLDKYYK